MLIAHNIIYIYCLRATAQRKGVENAPKAILQKLCAPLRFCAWHRALHA